MALSKRRTNESKQKTIHTNIHSKVNFREKIFYMYRIARILAVTSTRMELFKYRKKEIEMNLI